MQENNFIKIKRDLQQIADMLLLNGTLTECPGLVHGKMGIATFFFHYAQFTGKELFADYAMDVIGEMLDQIHINSPADYEKGIAGIGVGIDYLIRNGFLSIEDDICEDFDQCMTRAVTCVPWLDFTQYNGLIGLGRYWITRLHYPAPSIHAQECLLSITAQIDERKPNISTAEQTDVFCFLYDLQKISGFESCIGLLEQCQKKWNLQSLTDMRNSPRLGTSAISKIVHAYHRNWYFNDSLQNEIEIALKRMPALDMEKAPVSTGLLNGYAGEGMLRLTLLNQTNLSWMHLL
ncbi:hypothetical protein DW103_03620 [Parabacteroides sp. AM08-6]|nr:hypothetical protein DW103_03620 [Parabacteroides sp. AM08-6]